jgi:hypothetical protein
VLALVAKARRVDVSYIRKPLIWAWPFFLLSLALHLPELAKLVDTEVLRSISLVAAAAYVAYAAVTIWRHRAAAERDLVVFLFAAVLCLYFLPLAALYGKPYALLITFGAHAMQYYMLVLMSLSFSGWRSLAWMRTAVAFVIAASLIVAATFAAYGMTSLYGPPSLWDNPTVRVIVGLVTGVNLVHFWLDAFIWRFSDKRIRETHGEAFAF